MHIRKKWQILNRLATLLDYARERELAAKLKPIATVLMGLGVCAVLAAAIWVPKWQVGHTRGTTDANYFDRENAARRTLAQIIGGIIIVGGFYVSFRTFGLSRQAHFTDRFTKAIDQLGKTDGAAPNTEVRLGAIYALERIAIDSPRDHWAIMEILTGYIRLNAPPDSGIRYPECGEPRMDIQAILTVLGRRKTDAKRERPGPHVYLKLMPSCIPRANFNSANMKGADLEKVDLRGASFWAADLRGAALNEANLQEANFRDAKLRGAFFRGTTLNEANLVGADLTDARDLTTDQIRSARNWHLAKFSPAVRVQLGLPIEYTADSAPKPEDFRSLAE